MQSQHCAKILNVQDKDLGFKLKLFYPLYFPIKVDTFCPTYTRIVSFFRNGRIAVAKKRGPIRLIAKTAKEKKAHNNNNNIEEKGHQVSAGVRACEQYYSIVVRCTRTLYMYTVRLPTVLYVQESPLSPIRPFLFFSVEFLKRDRISQRRPFATCHPHSTWLVGTERAFSLRLTCLGDFFKRGDKKEGKTFGERTFIKFVAPSRKEEEEEVRPLVSRSLSPPCSTLTKGPSVRPRIKERMREGGENFLLFTPPSRKFCVCCRVRGGRKRENFLKGPFLPTYSTAHTHSHTSGHRLGHCNQVRRSYGPLAYVSI